MSRGIVQTPTWALRHYDGSSDDAILVFDTALIGIKVLQVTKKQEPHASGNAVTSSFFGAFKHSMPFLFLKSDIIVVNIVANFQH